jgi:predicted permease
MEREGGPGRSARQLGAEVDDEIRFHLEMRARELERRGESAERAWAEAVRRFGDVAATRAVCVASDARKERRMMRREVVRETVQDLVHAARQLRRRPGFAAVAVATLAVGIGATTAIVSVADHVLLRPLPYAQPERVVTLWETRAHAGDAALEVAPGNFLAWRERLTSYDHLGLAEPWGFDWTAGGPPEPLRAWAVTEAYIEALGVRPLHGRAFAPDEYAEGSGVIMLSHGFWVRRFGGDPNVVGTTMVLDGVPTTVIGVLPAGLEYPHVRDVWAPKWFREYEALDHSPGYMIAVGRLKPGVTMAAASSDARRVAALLAAEHAAAEGGPAGIRLVALAERVLGDVRPALLVLLGAVAFLLLIACVNVAGLLLAQGTARERELGIRVAHGAGRGRLVRQLLTEGLLLALLGGMLGLGIAYAGVSAMMRLAPEGLPRFGGVSIDGRVLLFSLFITVASVLVFGLVPALRFSRPNLAGVLGSSSRTATTARAGLRLRNVLVVGEIALALVLLAGAGLLGRSFVRLLAVDPGFAMADRATVQVFLSDRNPQLAQRLERIAELETRFAALPGVSAVATVSALPFHPSQIDTESPVVVDGAELEPVLSQTTIASPGYFRVMRIPVLAGRDFAAEDGPRSPPVAVISALLAERLFGAESALGRRITVGVMGQPVSREVVGVVGDVRPTRLDGDSRPEVYVPYAQSGAFSATFVVHAPRGAAALLPALRQQVWEVDPEQTIYHAGTVEDMIGATLTDRRFQLTLLGAFSCVALLLAAIGIYALVSFTTSRRARELGVRLALGAARPQLLALVLRQGVALAAAGTALGLLASVALTRFVRHMLFGVTPADPVTLLAIAGAMMIAAIVAATVPALRATRTDAASALRAE